MSGAGESWRRFDTAATHWVPARTEPGLRLALRAHGDAAGRKPVLFVHGATYASRLYDIPAGGASWLKATSAAGFAAYAVDMRGYGRSQSQAMDRRAGPYGRAAEVLADLTDVCAWLRERHDVDRIALVGGSWGSVTTALFAATAGRTIVDRLVLYAPIYAARNEGWRAMLADRDAPDRFGAAWGAFRWIDEAGTRARWDAEIPASDRARRRDEAAIAALIASSLADDPLSGTRSPQAFRAPNGALADLWECFNGRPLVDPAAIAAPTCLIRGSQDETSTRADALALFDRLGSREKLYLEVADCGHFASAERAGPAIFDAANRFLLRG